VHRGELVHLELDLRTYGIIFWGHQNVGVCNGVDVI
jgi:hypothetical protein